MLDDTVIFTKEKLTVKLHRMRDSVYVEAEYGADTVVIEREVPVERIIYRTAERRHKNAFTLFAFQNIWPVMIIIVGILFLVFIWRRFPR